MVQEKYINAIVAILLLAIPVIAWFYEEPFVITLATKVAILALAGAGLNLALGYGLSLIHISEPTRPY